MEGQVQDVLTKTACINKNKVCNIKPPYSKVDLYKVNPATGDKYTDEERNNKIKQYQNMCNLNDGIMQKCCDRKLKNYNNILPDEFKEKYFRVKEIKKNGKISNYDVCSKQDYDLGLCEDYRAPTSYDFCKLSNGKDNIVPDCYDATCSNDIYVPFLQSGLELKSESNYSDYLLVTALKEDDLPKLKDYFKSSNDYSRILKYGYPGNTYLHNAITFNSSKCLEFLLSNNLNLDIQNSDGNTPLHLACLSGNVYIINRLLQLGANINIENRFGDKAIHSAIRSGNLESVVLILQDGGSIFSVNKQNETPLFVAVVSPKKNMKIISELIELGSDLMALNKDNETMITVMNKVNKDSIDNRKVQTLLQNKCAAQYKSTYHKLIATHPEYSIIDLSEYMLDGEVVKEIPELDIDFPNEYVNDDLLYKNKQQLPKKINIPEYTDLDSSVDEEKYKITEQVIESFVDKKKQPCFHLTYFIIIMLLGLVIISVFVFYK